MRAPRTRCTSDYYGRVAVRGTRHYRAAIERLLDGRESWTFEYVIRLKYLDFGNCLGVYELHSGEQVGVMPKLWAKHHPGLDKFQGDLVLYNKYGELKSFLWIERDEPLDYE